MIIKKSGNINFFIIFYYYIFNLTLVFFFLKIFRLFKNDIKIFLFQPELNVKSFTVKENLFNFYYIAKNKFILKDPIDKIYINVNFINRIFKINLFCI